MKGLKGEGYVSDDSVGEDGSEQGDVVNGLFAEYENWEPGYNRIFNWSWKHLPTPNQITFVL